MTAPTDDVGRAARIKPLLDLVIARGYQRSEAPFTLSSGGQSHDYVDLRRAVAEGDDLRIAAESVITHLRAAGVTFDAIGGMTMGADPVAHAVALIGGTRWYSVRKADKSHGTRRRIEGAAIGHGTRVIVFEDTTSTGRSLLEAVEVVGDAGAEVVLALTLLDRGAATGDVFAAAGVPFSALLTYADLGIEPLGGTGQPAG